MPVYQHLAAVNSSDSRGRSLLWWACADGWSHLPARLISCGADPNAADKHFKRSPLMGALAAYSRPDTVKALLDNGADVHAKCVKGETPLDVLRAWGPRDHQDPLAYLLLLAEANVFKGAKPAAEWAPFIAEAVSQRAANGAAAAAAAAAAAPGLKPW